MEPPTHQDITEVPSSVEYTETTILNQWIYNLATPYIKGRILEVCSGNAEFTDYLIAGDFKFRISDPDREICDLLKQRFSGHLQINAIHKIDPYREDFDARYEPYINKFHTLIFVNRPKSSERQYDGLTNVSKLVRLGGYILTCIRTEIGLYNEFDGVFEYWRQLNRRSVKKALGRKFEIVKYQPFNSIHPLKTNAINFRKYLPEFQIDSNLDPDVGGTFAIVIAVKID